MTREMCRFQPPSRNDYLFRQDDPAVASLTYGRLGKTVDHVGCGLVSIYNVMRALGREQDFADILSDAMRLHMPWLFGVFGTKPRSLTRYFGKQGVPVERTDDCEYWRNALPACRAAIICTWNDKRRHGIHFYAVVNDNGRLSALNRYCDWDTATPFSPADVRADRFITGYLFRQKNI